MCMTCVTREKGDAGLPAIGQEIDEGKGVALSVHVN
jgi:hypothetical protein